MSCISYCKRFKKKYPSTVAWRIKENARIVDMHVNPDEEVSYAFVGQKNDSFVDFFETAAIAITNERILIGQKRVLFGYSLSSITPDLYNDMKVYEGVFWGRIIIDTVKEVIVISNLSKDSLVEIETQISSFMMKAKAKDNEE